MMSAHARRATLTSLRIALLIATFGTIASCKDDPTGPSNVSSVATMHLVFGNGATLDLTSNKGGLRTIHIPVNTPVTVTATFLRADGTPDPTVTAPTFLLEGLLTTVGVNYTPSPTDPFSGTVIAPIPTAQLVLSSVTGGGVSFGLVNTTAFCPSITKGECHPSDKGYVEFGPFTAFMIAP